MATHRFLIPVLLVTFGGCSASPPASSPPAPPPFSLGLLTKAARNTDKGPSLHNYTEIYERLFFQWKDDPIKILEIGIAEGGSLTMWQEYFPKARIFAVDIANKSQFDNDRVTTLVADQGNRDHLRKVVEAAGGDIDILLDDGGHSMEQQQVSLGYLFKFVRPGGYYVIEDVHTSLPLLWKGYGVERDQSNTTLRMLEQFVRSATPSISSKYMLDEEMADLNAHIESVQISYRAKSRSIVAILQKKASASAPPLPSP
jgi:hypothetical protein